MFTFAGAILGVLSVFGPLALLLALTALFNPPDEQQAVDAATGSSAQRADADAEKGEPPLQPATQPAPN